MEKLPNFPDNQADSEGDKINDNAACDSAYFREKVIDKKDISVLF